MSSPSSPERPAMVLAGRYELFDVIGRGGHGTVWRAQDRDTGRAVAVKMLNDVAASDPNLIERLKREQTALVSLAGTSAVEFIDLCRTPNGRLGLVMELLEGIDLEQRLEDLEKQGQYIQTAELLHLLAPIVATLERAHQAGILHRDLKPANIYIMNASAGGGVRLLDFGLARMRSAQPLTAAGMIVGSPSYIAPEVWKGRPDKLDQRVDVYSFGVAVFRALANRLPFEGSTLQDKFRMTTTAPRPSIKALRPDLPSDMDDWVEQVLAIDPDERFFTIRGAWNALLVSIRSEEFVENVATASDLASAAGSLAPLEPISTASPQLSPDRSLVSDWLSKSHYSVEPPPAPPPPSLRSTESGGGAVMVAKVVKLAGDPSQRADDNRSFVREWLVGSELNVPEQNSDDVASWLGVSQDESPAEPPRSGKPVPKPPRPPRQKKTTTRPPPPPEPEQQPAEPATDVAREPTQPVALSEVTQPSVELEAAPPKARRTRAAKPKKAPAKKKPKPKAKRKRNTSRRKRKK